MKTAFKKYISHSIIILSILLTGSLVQAQPQGQGRPAGPPPIPNAKQIQKMVAGLSTELSLNDQQETQISALYTAHFAQVEEVMEGSDRDAQREEMESLKKTFDEEVNAVLTDKQQTLYAAYQKKNDQRKGGRRPRN